MSKTEEGDKGTLFCSFCGKSQHEVRKLIAGPTVFICDECVELCMDIIREEHKTSLSKGHDGVPTPADMSCPRRICDRPGAREASSVRCRSSCKRLRMPARPAMWRFRSNILLVGPTECGKTLLAQTLADA